MNIPSNDTSFSALSVLTPTSANGIAMHTTHVAVRPEQSLLTQYWRIILRRKWTILCSIAVTIILGAAITLSLTRMYTATAVVQIARDDTKVLNVQGVRNEVSNADQEFYQTQYGLLKTRALAQRVVRSANLLADQDFRAVYLTKRGGDNDSNAPTSLAAASDELLNARDALLENVSIVPVRDSGLVQINYSSPRPALSAKIANAWGVSYIQANIDRGFDESKFARTYLEQRLKVTRARLNQSERDAVDYASQTGIFKLGISESADGRTTASQSMQEQRVAAFSQELNKALADRIAAEAAYRKNDRLSGDTGPQTAISVLRQKQAELSAEYQKMLVQFDPEYPGARALAQQIAQLGRAITSEQAFNRSSSNSDLRLRYEAALERERELREQVSGATRQLLNERRLGIQFSINEREVDTNRQLYDALLQRYKEIGIAGGVNRTNVSVADEAEVPTSPSSPRLALNLLLSAFLGTLIGIGLTIVREQFDDVISDPESVQERLGIPLLGTIPDIHDEFETPISALRDPKSPLTEAYLSLRTTLNFTTAHGVPRIFSLTSTRPAEGKSTTALALAAVLASAGKSVLLIDCDMRLPSIHTTLALSNNKGLSNVLSGNDDLPELIQHSDAFSIDVLTAGPTPPNSADLLESARFDNVLQALAEKYDHVVCDGPPVIGLADALILATKVDGTIYAVDSHETRINNARAALQRLEAVNARVLGLVMTKYEPKRSVYSYDYSYGYGAESKR